MQKVWDLKVLKASLVCTEVPAGESETNSANLSCFQHLIFITFFILSHKRANFASFLSNVYT
jgi:hypothetical protein